MVGKLQNFFYSVLSDTFFALIYSVKPSVILARVPCAYLITPPGAFFQSDLICEEGASFIRGWGALVWNSRCCQWYTVKKVRVFPVPRRDVTTKLSLGGNNDVITELFLPRGSLISDIPAGDGKLVNLFLRRMNGFRLLDLYILRCLQSPDSIMTVCNNSKPNWNNVIFFLNPIGQRAHTSICTHFGLPPSPHSSPGLRIQFWDKKCENLRHRKLIQTRGICAWSPH